MQRSLCISALILVATMACQKNPTPQITTPTTAAEAKSTTPKAANILYSYTLAYQDTLVARAILDAQDTVTLTYKIGTASTQKTMTARTLSNSSCNDTNQFPVYVYEYTFPDNATKADIATSSGVKAHLPVLPAHDEIEEIAFLGDSGCRKKGSGSDCQDCSATGWPLEQICDAIQTHNPDLIVHVGDYHYREYGCDCGNTVNGETVHCGNNWGTWEQDWFQPAAALFQTAPIVATRGNHEDGSRAFCGWFLFMDPAPMPQTIPVAFTDPYSIEFKNLTLIVMDVADVSGSTNPPSGEMTTVENLFGDVANMANGTQSDVFLVSHQPIWDFYSGHANPTYTLHQAVINKLNNQLPTNIKLQFAGHNHTFRWMAFEQTGSVKRAPEFIVGNGGANLYGGDKDLSGRTVANVTVKNGGTTEIHGFSLVNYHPKQKDWTLESFFANGQGQSHIYTIQNNAVTVTTPPND